MSRQTENPNEFASKLQDIVNCLKEIRVEQFDQVMPGRYIHLRFRKLTQSTFAFRQENYNFVKLTLYSKQQ